MRRAAILKHKEKGREDGRRPGSAARGALDRRRWVGPGGAPRHAGARGEPPRGAAARARQPDVRRAGARRGLNGCWSTVGEERRPRPYHKGAAAAQAPPAARRGSELAAGGVQLNVFCQLGRTSLEIAGSPPGASPAPGRRCRQGRPPRAGGGWITARLAGSGQGPQRPPPQGSRHGSRAARSAAQNLPALCSGVRF